MNYRKAKWKKGYRKLPSRILEKLSLIQTDCCRIECTKEISQESIIQGDYTHIGIMYQDKKLHYNEEIVPSKKNGVASRYNTRRKIIKHKDQEKVEVSYSFDSPNFGDWSKGSHSVNRTVMAYPKTILEPLYNSIKIEILQESEAVYLFKFSIDRLIRKDSPHFKREVLRDINLLQENVGVVDVYPSDVKYDDYLSNTQLDWVIFPPGTRDEIIQRIQKKYRSISSCENTVIKERIEILEKYNPEWIAGANGMQRYFGAKLRENLVVFENIRYGNAIYILQENWKDLSRLSRIELLDQHREEIIRIVHGKNWKRQLKFVIDGLL